jgi:hypothetical protein
MVLNEREYKFWITKNCDRRNCWIVLAQLGYMINHVDTKLYHEKKEVPREELSLVHDGLEYVYLVDFASDRLITLVQDKDYYYLIDNTEVTRIEGGEQFKDYKSSITYSHTITGLINTMSGAMRKKLKIKLNTKATLKKSEETALKGVIPLDFIGVSHDEQVALFKRYASDPLHKSCLDLSGFYILDPSVIVDTCVEFNQEQVVLYQNNRFQTFAWLKCFPKIKVLSMWYISSLVNDAVDELVACAPQLTTLEFHSCFQLNGRILIPISKLASLEKLVINYDKCNLQECAYETIIKDEEWAQIKNRSLKIVLIDSHNLTLDFIDFFLKSFKEVNHFIMNEIILDKLKTNSASGHKDKEDSIMFHSSKDTTNGFKRYKDVKVYDLVRNKCGNTYSESMLKIIRDRNPDKSDIIEQLES